MTRPSPRLAPVIRAIRVDSVMVFVTSNQHGSSIELQVLEVEKRRTLVTVGDALTIGEVASRSGVATSALRFYEEQRIASERTDSGHRRPRTVLRLVAFIVFAQKVGLSLEKSAGSSHGCRATARRNAPTGPNCRGWTKRIEADRGIGTNEDDAHRVYRLRMPFTRPLPVCEPRRSRGATRRRSALLDSIDGPLIPRGSHLLCSAIMPSSADVVIIGGGVVGSAVAYHLREAGCRGRIVVIERDDSYSRASSNLAMGGIRQQFTLEASVRMVQYSVGFYQDLDRRVPVAGVNFRQRGYLFLRHRQRRATRTRHARRCVRPALTSRGSAETRFGADCRMLLDDIEFGVFGPEDGYANPKAVLFAMKTIAEDAGAEYVRAEVHAIERTNNKVTGSRSALIRSIRQLS